MAKRSNGEGSVYREKSTGTWVAQIEWTDRSGQSHRKRWRSSKQAVVRQNLKDFRIQLLFTQGGASDFEGILFSQYSEFWLTEVLKPKLKPSSYMRKEVTLRNQVIPYIGNIPILLVKDSDIRAMIKELQTQGLSHSTIKKAYECVNGCFKYFLDNNDVFGVRNPCKGVTLPRDDSEGKDVVFFTKEQRELIVAEATRCWGTGTPVYRMGWAIPLLMYTGMRIGELLALTWEDVDMDGKTISINKNAVVLKVDGQYKLTTQNSTKTKSGRRIIPINSQAYKALLEIQKITGDEPYVICTANHRQVVPRKLNENFHHILERAGIMGDGRSYGVHTLRHTFASMLFQNGCSVKVVSELLGHSDTGITQNTYIHLINEQKVAAIGAIDSFIDD